MGTRSLAGGDNRPEIPKAIGRESWVGALLLAPFGPPPPADAELRSALRTKQGEPGWRAVGRVAS